jgi:hypothetical protein
MCGRFIIVQKNDNRESVMSQGDKSNYTNKQKRQAKHIEDSYQKKGLSKKKAAEFAWRTVNKQDGGANKK